MPRRGQWVGGLAAVAVAVATWTWAAPAEAAHPLVEQGRTRFEQADFAGALQVLEQAVEQGGLTREDLVLLLETRALVHRALGNDEETRRALVALASVDPDHRFAPEVSPDLVQRFAQLRDEGPGPLELDVSDAAAAGGVTLTAEVRNDVTGMVHAVSVSARSGGGEWRRSDRGHLELDAAPGARVEWYAMAYGPGGAPVARRGSEAAPRQLRVPGDGAATVATATATESDDGSSAGLWVGVGAGVVAVATAVTLAVVLSGGGGQADTRVEGPILPDP